MQLAHYPSPVIKELRDAATTRNDKVGALSVTDRAPPPPAARRRAARQSGARKEQELDLS